MNRVRSRDGTEIACYHTGSGPPLLLVHGAVADHTRWDPILTPLEAHFSVCTIDRRGRGGSGDTQPYAIQREFEDVAAVVDTLDEPVILLGHSFGAVCALEAALLTSAIHKLILYEPPPPGVKGTMPGDTAARIQAFLDASDKEATISTFLLEVAGLPVGELELMRSLPAWPGRVAAAHTILREVSSLEALPPFDADRFGQLRVPTLLTLGGDSMEAYKTAIKKLHAILPQSRISVMPGQQHIAMNTAPDLFVREVLAFSLDRA